MWKRLVLVLLMACLLPAAAKNDASLYDRVAARLARDPALAKMLGTQPKQMRDVAWLVGTWDVVAEVQAAAKATPPERGTSIVAFSLGGTWLEIRDTYPSGTQDLGFLSFSPVTRRWTSIGLDSLGNAVTTSGEGWRGNRLVVSGDVTIVGVRTTLRQTIVKQGDRAYMVTNEERRADGRWQLLDTYRYAKRK